MTGTLGELILAALAFLFIHIIPSSFLRERLVSRIGEKGYLAGFSLLSLTVLVWLVFAFRSAPVGEMLWDAGNAGRYLAMLLMLVALILFVSANTSPNPTAVGAGKLVERESAYSGVNTITRHPLMWSITLWSIAHIINNGEISAVVFFGAFGILAFSGTFLIDAKKARQLKNGWGAYKARTSNIPFAAILEGRAKLSIKPLWWRILLGIALYAVLFHFHAFVFGVSPNPI
ncbi:MAG: NnrU family protein [Sneathiella sp.]|nr:NnrU family protein [Sneathiella sp.]